MNLTKLSTKFPLKRAILTGAGSGVGLEILKILSKDGWRILAIDLNIEQIDSEYRSSANIDVIKLDITDRVKYKEAFNNFCETNDGVDILFNNAGVGEGVRFKDYSLNDWDWIIDVNVKAVISGCNYVFEHMKKQGSGLIVNMASAAAFANLPNMSPYNVTKAAVASLSESLAHEYSPYGIEVLCVTPTFFQSNILQHSKGTHDVLESASRIVDSAKLTSKDAAQIILSCLHKKKEQLRFPASANVLYYGKKIVPGLYKKMVRKFLVK